MTQRIHPWLNETAASRVEVQGQDLNAEAQDLDMIVLPEEVLEQGWKEGDRRQEENPRTLILQSFKGEDFQRPGYEDLQLLILSSMRTRTV